MVIIFIGHILFPMMLIRRVWKEAVPANQCSSVKIAWPAAEVFQVLADVAGAKTAVTGNLRERLLLEFVLAYQLLVLVVAAPSLYAKAI